MKKSQKKQKRPLPAPQLKPTKSFNTFITESLVVKIIIILQLIMLAVEFYPDLSTNGDDARYFILSKALITGQGFNQIQIPGSPAEHQYPILFPAFLAIGTLFNDNPLLPKMMVGILSILSLLIVYKWYKKVLGKTALIILLSLAASFAFAQYSTLVMSEIPFMFASFGALYLYEKYKERMTTVFLITAAVTALSPLFIRSIGIAFCLTMILTSLLERKLKYTAVLTGILALSLLIAKLASPGDSPYLLQLFNRNDYDPEKGIITATEMIKRIGENISNYWLYIIPESVTGVTLTKGNALWGFSITLFALAGFVRNFFFKTRIISIYAFFYFGILCAWQTQWASIRFLIPILPVLFLFVLFGFQTFILLIMSLLKLGTGTLRDRLLSVDNGKVGFVVPRTFWIALAILILSNSTMRLNALERRENVTPDWQNFYSCADWVRNNTPDNSIVVSRKPELFYLRSQRQGFVYPFSHDIDKVVDSLKRGNATYIILDNFAWTSTSARYLFPAIMDHQQLFKMVYSLRNPDTYVLEFNPR